MSKDMRAWLADRKAGTFRLALLRSAAPLSLLLAADPAWAACSPASPTDNAVVSCTGIPIQVPPIPNSFLSNANNLAVIVQIGAIMSTLPGGTAMTFGGNGLTLNNLGAIDANALGSAVLARALAVGNLVTPGSGLVIVDNQGSIEGNFDGTFGLDGAAVVVANRGSTVITNSGSIGLTSLGAFEPDNGIAVGIYGGGAVDFTNVGLITGRVAFGSPSSGGNRFVNAGVIFGSVSLGTTPANDTFVAVTGSSIGATGVALPGVNIPTPQVPASFLSFAATGTVDAGIGGNDTLVLQNTVAGPGSGNGGSGTVSTSQYLNFENLTVNSGTWTLQGAVVSGGATLNGGTALFDNALAFGTGTLTGNGGAIQSSTGGLTLAQNVNLSGGLIVQSPNSLTLGGTVSGSGGMIKSGAGTLTLAASNNFSGGFALNGGGLTLGTASSLGTGLFLVGGPASLNTAFTGTMTNQVQLNGALALNGAGDLTLGGNINGAGSLTLVSGNLALTGANNYTGGTVLQAGSIHAGSNGALGIGMLTVNGPAGLTAAGVALGNAVTLNNTLNFGAGGGALTLNGVISGAGGMSLAGAPGLVLNGANTFSGGFNLGGGALTVGHDTALGTAAVTVSGAGVLDANTAVSLANNFNLNAGLGIGGSSNLALNGTVGGLGGLAKSGAANLTLGGANSFAGGVNLQAGSLTVGANTSLGFGALTVNGPATLSANADVSLGNAVVLNADLAIDGANDIALGGVVSGDAGLSFSGTGTLALNGANTFGGGVQLHSGTLRLGGSIGLGTLAVAGNATLQAGAPAVSLANAVTLGSGVTLALSGANSLGLQGTISGGGGMLVNGSGTFMLGGANSFNGGAELRSGNLLVATSSSLGTGTLSVTGNASLTSVGTGVDLNNAIDLAPGAILTAGDGVDLILSGAIGGAGSLVMNGTRKLVLTGDNSFAGATTISAGTLQLGNGGGTGSVAGDIVNNSALVVDRSGVVALAGVISGTGTVTKTGSGTLILSGANSAGSQYTGTTTVNQGILRVDGTFGDTAGNAAQVNVASGGTLQGNGTIRGDVTVQTGGTLSAGASPGMLTVAGDLTLDAGSTSLFEFGTPNIAGGPTNDLVTVGGNLVMDGTLNVSAASAGYYRLFDVGGSIGGAFDTLVTPGFTNADVFVVPNQVNLSVRNASQLLEHWDGTDTSGAAAGAGGGDGVWNAADTNWTADPIAGAINDAWRGSVAVFGGAAGNVTVAPGTPSFDTLQFNTDGYHLLSGNLAIGVSGANAGNAALTGSIINVTTGTTTIDSIIQDGAGSHLNVVGSGTLVLTGANTYTGGTSLLSGTVSVDSDTNLGAASGGLTFDGGILQVRGNAFTGTSRTITWGAAGGGFDIASAFNTFTVSQALGGTGALVKRGAGTLVISGANSYSGGTTISQGTLSVGATGALGSGAVAVGAGSTLLFQSGTSAGSLQLTTASSTGAGINGGFIQFADGSSADHAQIVNGSLGAVSFRGGATADAAQFDNAGTVSFWESASAGSATILNRNGGSTNFVDGASAGQATISIMAGGVADFFDSSTAANAVINNDGTVVFRDTSSAGAARIVNGGRVLFRANADASAAQITNTAGGSVDISRATASTAIGALSGAGNVLLGSKTLTLGGLGGDQTISGIIQDGGAGGGTGGSLVKTGAGTLILGGANSYTGTTTINAGTLQISADANLGAGGLIFTGGTLRTSADMTSGRAVTFTGNGTLLTDAGTTLTLSGSIAGSGGLTKTGAGILALAGDSSAFTGTTSVGQGVLSVNGRLGGTVDVLAGGRLQGTGTVGTVTVAGAIAPGNSIGTLIVNGNYTQLAGSTYEAEIAPDGTSDRIDVTGAASIQGGTVFAAKATGSYTPGSRYTILTAAGGVTGSYAALDQNAPFIDLALGYDPKTVYLDVVRNTVAFPTIGETPNQKATAAGAESLGEGNALYNAVAGVPDVPSALAAFDGLSGEMNASTVTGMLEDSRFVREAMNDRLRSAFETVGAVPLMGYGEDAKEMTTAAVTSERYGAWGSVFGSWGRFDSDGNAARLSRSVGGFVTGIDGSIVDDVRLGFLAGYSHSSLKVDDRRSSAATDNYHLGIYGGAQWGALALRSGLAYTWSEIDSSRQVAFPGFTDSLTGDYRAGTTQVFGELGYGLKAGSVAFEPFANLAYVNVHTNGFTEQGGAAALTVHGGSNDVTFTTLGIRASTDFDLGTVRATARGMVGWRHGFGDITPTISQAFTGSSVFQIAGAPIAKDAATLEAGLDFAIAPRATLGVSYQGQVGSGASDHGVRADLSVRF